MLDSSADRQLLLGMFAVHLGLCKADDVCDAVSTWSSAPETSLAGQFDYRGMLTGRQIRLVEDLVDERLLQGADKVWSWCSRNISPVFIQMLHESGADSIRPRLQVMAETVDQSMGKNGFQLDTEIPATHPATRSVEGGASFSSGDVSRYRIMRMHAQGGLGTVSVAEDLPIGREVAFKEMRHDRASDITSRSRFLLEAKVTGRLEHPSIVPIYDVGAHKSGDPFYVMRFIHGESLKEILRRFHAHEESDVSAVSRLERNVEFRSLLSRFVDVCQAVEYAHKHGVIHRDLKPANIMLGEYGETLLVDWGLAKVIGQEANAADEPTLAFSAHSSSDLTMEGAAIGTPAYMSPEQASGAGDRITTSTDIYGLGATLFCIVTGRAPVSGKTLGEVIDKVQSGQIEVHLERCSSGVPPALWAICRRAMQTESLDRYDSAADLAKDIERFLADEPVSAMQEPLLAQAKRWIRRHPALVSTATAVSLMAAVSLSVGLSVVTGFSSQLRTANGQLSQANTDLASANESLNQTNLLLETANLAEHEARVEAEENLQLAATSVDTFLSQVTDNAELQRPDLTQIRASLLASAVPYFEQILEQAPGDVSVEFMRGKALIRLADIHQELRDTTLAVGEAERAVEILKGVVNQDPTNTDYLFHLAVAQNNLGTLLNDQMQFARSQEVFEETLETRRLRDALLPDDYDGRRDRARTITNLGWVAGIDGDFATSIERHLEAMAIRQELVDEVGRTTETLYELANSYHNIGISLTGDNKNEESLAAFQTAEQLYREMTTLGGVTYEQWNAFAGSLDNLGTAYGLRGNLEQAINYHQQLVEVRRRMSLEYPLSIPVRLDLAKSLVQFTETQRQCFQFTEALTSMQEMLTLFEGAQAEFGSDFVFRKEYARAHFVAGELLKDVGQYTQSNEHLRESTEMLNAVIDDLPDGSHEQLMTQDRLAVALDGRASSLSYLGDHIRAEQLFLEAAELRGFLAEHLVDRVAQLGGRADCLHNAANEMCDQERHEEARIGYSAAIEIREALLEERPHDEYLLSQQATTFNGLAIAYSGIGDHDACRENYLHCMEMCDSLCALNPENLNYRTTGGGAACNLGNLEFQLGDMEAAHRWYDVAVNEFDAVLAVQPNMPLARRFMTITLNSRGYLLRLEERYVESAADYERTATLCEPGYVPYYKMYEAYSRASAGEREVAVQLATLYASTTSETRFTAALIYALAAKQVDDETQQEVYLKTAMRYLIECENEGYFMQEDGLMRLNENVELDILRDREDFVELISRVDATST